MNNSRLSSILLGAGAVLLILAIAGCWVLIPKLAQNRIRKTMRLVNGSDTFNKRRDIPIPIYMNVYMFNVTNPDEVVIGQKPVLTQVGPYVYQQKRRKIVESISEENDTLVFHPQIQYTFRPDLSAGTEADLVTVVNIPFISVAESVSKMATIQRYVVTSAIEQFDQSVFVRRTIGQMLFGGYYEPMFKELAELKGEEITPNNIFGLYYGKNGTSQARLEIYSGAEDSTRFGSTISWNRQTQLPMWGSSYCNMINGSDGSIFPPFVTRDRVLRIFSPDMCRSLYMTYEKDVNIMGIPGYQFLTPKEVLQDPRVYADNACYCTNPGNNFEQCLKGGVFHLAPCRKGAPIVASWPHFYDGDAEYVNQSIGLIPNQKEHETFIVLEPNTGALLSASKRFQINVDLKPMKYFNTLKKVPRMLVPVLWVDESVVISEDSAGLIKNRLLLLLNVANVAGWTILALGSSLMLIGLLLYAASKKEVKKQIVTKEKKVVANNVS